MSTMIFRPRKRLAVYRTTSTTYRNGQSAWVTHAWWADLRWSTILCHSWQEAMDLVNRELATGKKDAS